MARCLVKVDAGRNKEGAGLEKLGSYQWTRRKEGERMGGRGGREGNRRGGRQGASEPEDLTRAP